MTTCFIKACSPSSLQILSNSNFQWSLEKSGSEPHSCRAEEYVCPWRERTKSTQRGRNCCRTWDADHGRWVWCNRSTWGEPVGRRSIGDPRVGIGPLDWESKPGKLATTSSLLCFQRAHLHLLYAIWKKHIWFVVVVVIWNNISDWSWTSLFPVALFSALHPNDVLISRTFQNWGWNAQRCTKTF